MRIYEGSPRQDFEEVLRSIGAFLDQRGMREVLLVEAPDGFIVQGLVVSRAGDGRLVGVDRRQIEKETLTFLDDDIARFMDEAIGAAQRGQPEPDFAGRRPLRAGVPRHRPLHRRAEAARHLLLRAGRRVRRCAC